MNKKLEYHDSEIVGAQHFTGPLSEYGKKIKEKQSARTWKLSKLQKKY